MKYLASVLTLLLALNCSAQQNIPGTNDSALALGYFYSPFQTAYSAPANNLPSTFNFTRVFVPTVPTTSLNIVNGLNSPLSVKVATTYTSGWGKTLQRITRAAAGPYDLVEPQDNRVARNHLSFLPYPKAGPLSFQASDYSEQAAYYSNDPEAAYAAFSREELFGVAGGTARKACGAGAYLAGGGRGTLISTHYNGATEVARWDLEPSGPVLNGYYAAGEIRIVVTNGQHDAQSREYYDRDNRLLRRDVAAGGSGSAGYTYLSTCYVYDDYGRIAWVLTPKAVAALMQSPSPASYSAILSDLCFRYEYDDYGKVTVRHVPGKAGLEETIYDRHHRPVLFRSPLLASQGKWQFTIYDSRDRILMTGLYASPATRNALDNALLAAQTSAPAAGTLLWYLLDGVSYASGAGDYPTAITDCELLGYNYYDSYEAYPSVFSNSFMGHYASFYDGTSAGAQVPQAFTLAQGRLVASRTRMLSTGQLPSDWSTSVFFYDRKGQPIQTQTLSPWHSAANPHWDVVTSQYDFAGKVLRQIVMQYGPAGTSKDSTLVVTAMSYNLDGRLTGVRQKTDQQVGWRDIAQYSYDNFGRVASKNLGGVENQLFEYDFAGRLRAVNRAYVQNVTQPGALGCTFGEILSYEQGFTEGRFDGAISGFVWKGAASAGKARAYGYHYDLAGRMTGADFNEGTVGGGPSAWSHGGLDYSVTAADYDANGNLSLLRQRGMGLGQNNNPAPVDMDRLDYSYAANSNQLLSVTDQVQGGNGANHDFRDGPNSGADYSYDADGNLAGDKNKGITAITYNYLDLPETVSTATGTITNRYDAGGALLEKTITNGSNPPQVYRYAGGFTYLNGELQQFDHAEGRCRWIAAESAFKYDYFVKDHLGNVRSVVTADVTTSGDEYLATHELASAGLETLAWARIAEVRDDSPPFINAPTGAGLKSAGLDGSDPDKRIGTALLLQAMAGDQFRLSAWAAYDPEDPEANDNESTAPEDMLSSLLGALTGGAGGFEGGITPESGGSTEDLLGGLLSSQNITDLYGLVKQDATDPGQPRAYLNWIVFDENMMIVKDKSGAAQVTQPLNGGKWGLLDPFSQVPLRIDRNGFLLVYISDEQHRKVFFDNVTVEHVRGRLLEENHYYPFGLTLRTVAPGGLAAREKYQGKELQEELGMELYDFHARQYDPQIGRFWGLDPLDQFPSGYTGMGNDPANMIDPTGMETKVSPMTDVADRPRKFMGGSGDSGFGDIDGLKEYAWYLAGLYGEEKESLFPGGGMSGQGGAWIVNASTSQIIWNPGVFSESNTPEGHFYIGESDNSILRFLNLNKYYDDWTSNHIGFLPGSATDDGFRPPWTASQSLNIKMTTDIDLSLNISQVNGIKVFNGITLTVWGKQWNSSAKDLTATGEIDIKYGGRRYSANLSAVDVNQTSIGRPGYKYSRADVFIPASQLNYRFAFPSIRITGNFWEFSNRAANPVVYHPLFFPKNVTYTHRYGNW